MARKVKLIIVLFGFFGVLLAANLALAADFGLNTVNNGLANSLSASDPRVMVGRIIQIALSFLGVIAIILIMFAGFLWATSDGDEEKITRAKQILQNAVIGLVIILSAWGITTFLLTQLSGAISGNGNGNYGGGGGGLSSQGAGTIGACSVVTTYPTSGQQDVPRNSAVMVTFRDNIQPQSICVNNTTGAVCSATTACQAGCNKINPVTIRLYKTDLGDACTSDSCPSPNSNVTGVIVNIANDGKTLVLAPASALGSADGDTPYSIKFMSQVKKADGSSMFTGCGTNFSSWGFTVNTNIDLTPPIVAPSTQQPLPDNTLDIISQTTPAKAATGQIAVNAQPQVYTPAQVLVVTPSGATSALNYHGSLAEFKVAVPAGSPDSAQLFDGNNNPLAVANFNAAGQAIFNGFMTFNAASHPVGSLWDIKISPEKLADTLTINSNVYTFATSSQNNNIAIPTNFSAVNLAANIEAKISGEPNLNVGLNGSTVALMSKVAGVSGNNINLNTSNPSALQIVPLAGGADQQELNKVQDKPDRPMNTVIQLNFNKAINPITVSGSASEVNQYIRVANANASSSPAGAPCSSNADCQSYKCSNSVCVGDYLGGNFTISNNYRTVEFTSDQECGINGCGQKIYCLPPNSHIAVKVKAADLQSCTSNSDCSGYGAFNICAATSLGYKTCQNSLGQNYPTANLSNLDGITDASLNSLDGNRDGAADGPVAFYNDNYSTSSPLNINQKDKYEWSFYISDKLMLTPPQITAVTPTQGQTGAGLADPIQITFNTVMMNSTLTTGSVLVSSGTSMVSHKLINLWSLSAAPLGYWISADNEDLPPLDGIPDITVAKISHSPLPESATFRAEVGSGVEDIYQNCYKPSVGPGCSATDGQPSCCFGSATNILGTDGNCQ
jgi:hypothetical protein